MRSSSVTSPAVPPYSSTTMDRWNLRSCISRSSPVSRFVSGTKLAERTWRPHGVGAVAVALGPHEVLGVSDADDVVDVVLVDRQPAAPGGQRLFEGPADGRLGLEHDHVRAGHHHLADDGVAEVDDRVDERPLGVLDDVLGVGDVGHRQQLGLGHVRRLLLVARPPADQQVGQPDEDAGDGPDEREADDGGDERRAEQRRPLGVVHGPVLRHRLEDDEDDRRPRRRWPTTTPSAPTTLEASTPTSVAETSWQMSTSSRTALRNCLGVLDQADEPSGAPPVLVEQRLGLHPARPDQAGLGQRQQPGDRQQDQDDGDQQPVDGTEAGGGDQSPTR